MLPRLIPVLQGYADPAPGSSTQYKCCCMDCQRRLCRVPKYCIRRVAWHSRCCDTTEAICRNTVRLLAGWRYCGHHQPQQAATSHEKYSWAAESRISSKPLEGHQSRDAINSGAGARLLSNGAIPTAETDKQKGRNTLAAACMM